jgi:4-diphosphocytidyl-2-C-methyl-D-erythritol kinase
MSGVALMKHRVLLAPAKVNLTLHVLGRRADGYHDIDSVMVPISLYDRVEIRVAAGRRAVACRVTGPQRVAGGPTNLAARAAASVLDELGVSARVQIVLEKRIPAGAGLGGGSSDAAAVLRALPPMLGRKLAGGRLARIARGIGADVPFFLSCRPARATGIGESLEPLPSFPRADLVVVVPTARVETAWAYRHALGWPRGLTSGATDRTRRRRLPRSVKSLRSLVFNDFERGVGRVVPDIERLARRLRSGGAVATVMSGTGSAVVGIFESAERVRSIAEAFSAPDLAFAVRIIARRPAARV